LLTQRVASATIGVPVIVILIWIGGWAYAAVVAVALAVAALEFQHLRYAWSSAAAIAAAVIVGGLALAARQWGGEPVLVTGAVAAAVSIATGAYWFAQRDDTVEPLAWVALGVLYVGVIGATIVLLRDLPNGRDWVYMTLLSTFAVDTAAYFTGRAIGRHQLAPRISPKKTWEGFFGGCAGGFAAAVALNYALGLRVDPGNIVLIGVLLPLAATVGDLLESALKRWTGVKDASDLIPGHGGVLDRLDSVLLTFALVYVIARVLVL
jgi:phosphatidate cytidylyltransferase